MAPSLSGATQDKLNMQIISLKWRCMKSLLNYPYRYDE